MKKNEFSKLLRISFAQALQACEGVKLEPVNLWNGERIGSVFMYGAISEKCMERQLKELKGLDRKTTFMSDLSIAEWCGGYKALLDTIKNCMLSWKDDETYMAEFVLCVNWKAWEHNARGNAGWSRLYSALYEVVRDLTYQYYEHDKKKTAYVWEYLD